MSYWFIGGMIMKFGIKKCFFTTFGSHDDVLSTSTQQDKIPDWGEIIGQNHWQGKDQINQYISQITKKKKKNDRDRHSASIRFRISKKLSIFLQNELTFKTRDFCHSKIPKPWSQPLRWSSKGAPACDLEAFKLGRPPGNLGFLSKKTEKMLFLGVETIWWNWKAALFVQKSFLLAIFCRIKDIFRTTFAIYIAGSFYQDPFRKQNKKIHSRNRFAKLSRANFKAFQWSSFTKPFTRGFWSTRSTHALGCLYIIMLIILEGHTIPCVYNRSQPKGSQINTIGSLRSIIHIPQITPISPTRYIRGSTRFIRSWVPDWTARPSGPENDRTSIEHQRKHQEKKHCATRYRKIFEAKSLCHSIHSAQKIVVLGPMRLNPTSLVLYLLQPAILTTRKIKKVSIHEYHTHS